MCSKIFILTKNISPDKAISGDISADYAISIFCTDMGVIKTLSKGSTEILSEEDSIKKGVNFYPNGHELAASVDMYLGIRLWDIVRGQRIYSYNIKGLCTQSFSPKGILCAASEYNVKFFDLKVRYSVDNVKISDARILEWRDENTFYAVNDVGIHEFDVRNLENKISVDVGGIKDFKSMDGCGFFTTRVRKQCYLTKMNDMMVEKTCLGERMAKIGEGSFCIGVLSKNLVEVFTKTRTFGMRFNSVGNIRMMQSNMPKNRFLLFTEDGIHEFYHVLD